MKVGDLVQSSLSRPIRGLDNRYGIIIAGVSRYGRTSQNEIFKVLWNEPCPSRPGFVGTSWDYDLEVICEGR